MSKITGGTFGDEILGVIAKIRRRKLESEIAEAMADQPDAVAMQGAAPVTRISVFQHAIPWIKKNDKKPGLKGKIDPVPVEIRKRFDSKSKELIKPILPGISINAVAPTDRVCWGVDESDLLMALRTGSIRKMWLAGGGKGLMVVNVESSGGGTFHGYMWMESLRSALLRQIWSDLIDFSEDGTLAMRATCVYEISKACGVDDLVPPTVHRFDENNELAAMLPDDLIEQINEWVASVTGKSEPVVRAELTGHAMIQLARGESWPIESEEWFKNIFGGKNPDAMNTIWSTIPDSRSQALLRLAALDFITGSLDRSFGDLAFSADGRHPLIAFGGELSVPCPRVIGMAYAEHGHSSYIDIKTDAMPLFWSDLATLLAMRGGVDEVASFTSIGVAIAGRMRTDRPAELARSLIENGLTKLQIAGVLSRIWMLATFAGQIAKDPYLAASYYADIVEGKPSPSMEGVKDFVNNTMRHVNIGEFDFYKEMKKGGVSAAR